VEISEKRGQPTAAPVHQDRATFQVWLQFMQNPLRKHPRAFVKVVDGSEIYNFPIHLLVHFSCKNSSYFWSNVASPTRSGRPRRYPRSSAPARAVPPPQHLGRSRCPEAASSRGWEHSEALEVRAHAMWSPRPRCHPRTAMSAGPPRVPPARAPVEAARRTAS
jgi:hypothetical protein